LLRRSWYYLAGLAVIPLLLALFAYVVSEQHIKSVANTQAIGEFLLGLDGILSSVQDAETGQRGYLLTGSEIYLTPYKQARNRINQQLSDLAASASQVGEAPSHIDDLKSSIHAKMTELESVIALYNSGRKDVAAVTVRSGEGQREMESIRSQIASLKGKQTTAFVNRYAKQVAHQKYTAALLAFATAASLLLLLFVLRVGVLYARERDETEQQTRRLNEELEARVRDRTAALEARTMESEAKSAELARSNADLAQFASVASHDLQEPLRMVAGYMGMLSRKYGSSLDEKAQSYIQYATEGATRMQTLINDLLTYSQAGTEAITKHRKPFAQIVEQALQNLRVAIDENRAVVRYQNLPEVTVDPIKMTQVVQNLVGNAIKFRKQDVTPEIEIGAEAKNSFWVFSVRDNGIGFDPKYQEQIFGAFQRLHGTGTYPGSGIGLSVCRRIIGHHGGRLWAESTPDAGSTFFFMLPRSEN
jgi:signal transduction histidine kinase